MFTHLRFWSHSVSVARTTIRPWETKFISTRRDITQRHPKSTQKRKVIGLFVTKNITPWKYKRLIIRATTWLAFERGTRTELKPKSNRTEIQCKIRQKLKQLELKTRRKREKRSTLQIRRNTIDTFCTSL